MFNIRKWLHEETEPENSEEVEDESTRDPNDGDVILTDGPWRV